LTYCLEQQSLPKHSTNSTGQQASDFHLDSLDGQEHLTLSELRGSPVLLAFISPTCHHCRRILPHLPNITHNWQEKGGKLVILCEGAQAHIAKLVEELDITFPVFPLEQTNLSQQYGITTFPRGIAIDTRGFIIASGPLSMQTHVEVLLEELNILHPEDQQENTPSAFLRQTTIVEATTP
jgi:thiol-disulfide isomerase/thioredoxin